MMFSKLQHKGREEWDVKQKNKASLTENKYINCFQNQNTIMNTNQLKWEVRLFIVYPKVPHPSRRPTML